MSAAKDARGDAPSHHGPHDAGFSGRLAVGVGGSRMEQIVADPDHRQRQMLRLHKKGALVRSLESLKFFALHMAVTAGSAGLAKTATAPLLRAQVVLQVQAASVQGSPYRGAVDYLLRASGREGLWSHWRGNGAAVLRLFPEAAIRFYVNDQYQVLFSPRDKDKTEVETTVLRVALGAFTALVTTTLTYPLDLAAARLAADQSAKGAARLYRGITDCLHITYRREGILGPWRGLLPSLLVVAPFYGTQIGTYYTLSLAVPSANEDKHKWWYPWAKMGAGLAAGMAAAGVSYPLDTLRRRMQVQGALGYLQPARRQGMMATLREILANEGLRGLYRGWTVGVWRMAPAGMVHFFAYDLIRSGAIMVAPSTAPAI